MSKIYRCQCRNVTNHKICAHRSKNMYFIERKRFCTFHLNYHMKRYATIIQKFFRGYNHRKLLNIIYKKLPHDIQRKIIYYIREDFHYQKYINVLKKIINKKLNFWPVQRIYYRPIPPNIHTIEENLNNIQQHFNLYCKYKFIINIDNNVTNKMHILGEKIKETIYNHTRLQDDPDFVNRSFNLLYYKIDYYLDNNTILSSES